MRWVLAVIAVAGCHHGSAPPPPASCAAAAEHVYTLLEPKDELARDIRGVFVKRCGEDQWPADVRECVMSTTSLKDPKHCKARLVLGVRTRLDTDLAAASARARDRDLPEACRAYEKLVDRLIACDKLPQSARDAMRQGFDAMRKTWAGTDPAARKTAVESCKVALDAVNQMAGSLGCPLL